MGQSITKTLPKKTINGNNIINISVSWVIFKENNFTITQLRFHDDIKDICYRKLTELKGENVNIEVSYQDHQENDKIIHHVYIENQAFTSSKVSPTDFGWALD